MQYTRKSQYKYNNDKLGIVVINSNLQDIKMQSIAKGRNQLLKRMEWCGVFYLRLVLLPLIRF